METFMNQLWYVLMFAFVGLGFLAVVVCSIWLVKIVTQSVLHTRAQKNTHS